MKSSQVLCLSDEIATSLPLEDQHALRETMQDLSGILEYFRNKEIETLLSRGDFLNNLSVDESVMHTLFLEQYESTFKAFGQLPESVHEHLFDETFYPFSVCHFGLKKQYTPHKIIMDTRKIKQYLKGKRSRTSWHNTSISMRNIDLGSISPLILEQFLSIIHDNKVFSLSELRFHLFPEAYRRLFYTHFSNCHVLKLRSLDATKLSRDEFECFCQSLNHLKSLSLTEIQPNDLPDDLGLLMLESLHQLLDLNIDLSFFQEISQFPSSFSHTRSLGLSSGPLTHSIDLGVLFSHFPHLQYLTINFPLEQVAKNTQFDTLFEDTSSLKQLTFMKTDFSKLDQQILLKIFSPLKNLQILALGKNNFRDMTDHQLRAMFQPLSKIQSVYTSGCGYEIDRIIQLVPALKDKINT